MMKQSFLFSPGQASEPYEVIRDESRWANEKVFLEELWTQYRPYANERDFLSGIRQEDGFYQRLWELHLGCMLHSQRYQLQRSKKKGLSPDFLVSINNKKVWIEATAPTIGTKEDAVPQVSWRRRQEIREVQEPPEEQILLRFTNAIDKKLKKYNEKYLGNIISQDDCYIIAISGSCLGYWQSLIDSSPPYIIRSVLPIGREMASFGNESDSFCNVIYSRREKILKKNDEPIQKPKS